VDPDQVERQIRAHVATEVIRYVNRADGPRELKLYNRAVAVLTDYLEPAVPEDEDLGDYGADNCGGRENG